MLTVLLLLMLFSTRVTYDQVIVQTHANDHWVTSRTFNDQKVEAEYFRNQINVTQFNKTREYEKISDNNFREKSGAKCIIHHTDSVLVLEFSEFKLIYKKTK